MWDGGSPAVNWRLLADAAYIPGFEPRAAYADGELVGLVVWGPYHPADRFLDPAIPDTISIEYLMIDASYQRQGLGRLFVDAVVATLTERRDCQRIVLSVHPDNTAALACYDKTDFQICGHDQGNDVLMEYLPHEH